MWTHDDAYERFMGRWSRRLADQLVGRVLDDGAGRGRWLDVGCGPGAVIAACLEADVQRVDALDPSVAFVEAAQDRFDVATVGVRVGHAEDLAGFRGPYDAVICSLVLNFTPDPVAALRAMRSVLGFGGTAHAAVWDHADERSFLARFWAAVEDVAGGPVEEDERTAFAVCAPDGLAAAAASAGWTGEVTRLDVTTRFAGPDDLWEPFLGGAGPAGAWVAAGSEETLDAVRTRLVADVFGDQDGPVTLPMRALVVSTDA